MHRQKEDIGTRPMFLLGGLAMLSSLQLICFGVMAEMLTRIFFESSGKSTYLIRDVHSNDAHSNDVHDESEPNSKRINPSIVRDSALRRAA